MSLDGKWIGVRCFLKASSDLASSVSKSSVFLETKPRMNANGCEMGGRRVAGLKVEGQRSVVIGEG